MLELEQALNRILSAMPRPASEIVPFDEAAGRILADRLLSPIDLPPFDNSAMDGYAVRALDVLSASAEQPATVTVCGKVPAGKTLAGRLSPQTCVRLFTGSPLPEGADAVVMQEDTRTDPSRPNAVDVIEPVVRGENVRLQGSDIRRGTPLGEAGQLITIGRLSLLAATGIEKINAGRRPRVGLLATGSELRRAGQALGPGEIYESNCLGLEVLTGRAGGLARRFPLVPDTAEATMGACAHAECDIVITCGGVSVGEYDFVKSAFEEIGGSFDFWQVAIKPGKPFAFGMRDGKFVFGLPGNPVSALVTFLLLVRPALLRWQGARDTALPTVDGVLTEALENTGGRRHFMRVKFGKGGVESAGHQASHVLSSLADADGLVDVPPKTTLHPGDRVRVLRWE